MNSLFEENYNNILCDVIWENSAYGGTKRTGSDLFVKYEHPQTTHFPFAAQNHV